MIQDYEAMTLPELKQEIVAIAALLKLAKEDEALPYMVATYTQVLTNLLLIYKAKHESEATNNKAT